MNENTINLIIGILVLSASIAYTIYYIINRKLTQIVFLVYKNILCDTWKRSFKMLTFCFWAVFSIRLIANSMYEGRFSFSALFSKNPPVENLLNVVFLIIGLIVILIWAINLNKLVMNIILEFKSGSLIVDLVFGIFTVGFYSVYQIVILMPIVMYGVADTFKLPV